MSPTAHTRDQLSLSPRNATQANGKGGGCTRSTQFDDADVRRRSISINTNRGHTLNPLLDGIGDVGHNLHSFAQEPALALLGIQGMGQPVSQRSLPSPSPPGATRRTKGEERKRNLFDDVVVDLSGGDVVVAIEREIHETLIVAQIQVGLTSVVQHEDLVHD